jgi:endonuclease/exonuclease/phosphatase family metal-dependent hydrolase
MSNTLDLMSWNIKAGGFDEYDPGLAIPSRETEIQGVVMAFHAGKTSSAVCVTDAYRWDELYGDNSGIARHLGYQDARFVQLDDERLRAKGEGGIGIAFATDRCIQDSRPLDLETRQGLQVVLDVGKYGLQIAGVYLDDMSEDVRLRQVRALMAGLDADVPTLLIGDFNALRPTMKGASIGVKARDVAVHSLASLLPKRSDLGASVKGMNMRKAVPLIESFGYTDADQQKRPTSPASLPIFGIDYVFHNQLAAVDNFQVLPERQASDHRPLTFEVTAA